MEQWVGSALLSYIGYTEQDINLNEISILLHCWKEMRDGNWLAATNKNCSHLQIFSKMFLYTA